MNIYGDESGSINNSNKRDKYFVITLVKVDDKKPLLRAYKRFVSGNLNELKELDKPKYSSKGKLLRDGGKMFDSNGHFIELKGSQFDRNMKKKFISSFYHVLGYELYFIKYNNSFLQNGLCSDISTAFNYPFRLAIEYFYKKGFFVDEPCHIQLDTRNEKTDKKMFLEQYLNTELGGRGIIQNPIDVQYFDSKDNRLVQIADVFSNIYYSHLYTGHYNNEIAILKNNGILRFEFVFPLLSIV